MDFLKEVEDKLDLPDSEKSQVLKELQSHYCDLMDEYTASGMSEDEAAVKAAQKMGDPADIARRTQSSHWGATWKSAILAALPVLIFSIIPTIIIRHESITLTIPESIWILPTLIIASIMLVVSLRELVLNRRPVWLVTWLPVSIDQLIKASFFYYMRLDLSVDTLKNPPVELLKYPMNGILIYVFIWGLFTIWLYKDSIKQQMLASLILILTSAIIITGQRYSWWNGSENAVMVTALIIFLLTTPLLILTAIRLFSEHPYGNASLASLFMYAAIGSTHATRIGTSPDILQNAFFIILPVFTILLYTRYRSWSTKFYTLMFSMIISTKLILIIFAIFNAAYTNIRNWEMFTDISIFTFMILVSCLSIFAIILVLLPLNTYRKSHNLKLIPAYLFSTYKSDYDFQPMADFSYSTINHESPKSIYVHIPFCVRKCLYCDFASYPGMESFFDDYVDALKAEIRRAGEEHPDAVISTVYFGGGTPTILRPDQLSDILDEIREAFTLDPDAEITTEANPGVSADGDSLLPMFEHLRESGFNRLSLGVQSFNDSELRLLGRIHSADDAVCAFGEAREAGFDNISIDLMYGIPEQTFESWRETLNKSVDLKPNHISLYSLTVEEGTPFHRMQVQGALSLPGDDIEADMYEEAIRTLTEAGYEHYEISNFAMPGFWCRHNITYWRNEPYFGFGAGAASYIDGIRAANTSKIDEYIDLIKQDESSKASEESLPPAESMGETMFLGLRMLDGVDIDSFMRRYGTSPMDAFSDQIDDLLARGLILVSDNHIRLTHQGLLFANDVFTEFVI